MTQATPTQDLVAKDLHGYEWRFKHIFRGQPRRHLLTTGWSTFVTSKRLVAGDAFVFLRGDNGELRVGVRRLTRQQSPMPPSVISSQSMHLGVLATASHAMTTQTLFVVYYKPRTSQFIIGLNKYLESVSHGFSVGMRFKMRFEGEESPERRFTGTIVGTDGISSEWLDSKWRSLKIQWDEPATIQRPKRVSPWELEPFAASASVELTQPMMKIKRPRPIDLPHTEPTASSAASPFWCPGSATSLEFGHFSTTEVQSKVSQVVWPPRQKELDSNIPNSSNLRSSRGNPDGMRPTSVLMNGSLNLFRETEEKKNVLTRSVVSDYTSPVSSRASNGLMLDQVDKGRKPDTSTSCRLFGFDLRNNSNPVLPPEKEVASPNVVPGSGIEHPTPATVSEADRHENPDLSKSSKEKKQVQSEALTKVMQSELGSTTSTRSRTKVQMEGVAVGRAVDLSTLDGYNDLITGLEKMFEIQGELHPRNKWEVAYTDDKGDMMLVGNDPWPEFCRMVRKIFIFSTEAVKKMILSCKLPMSSLEGEGTLVSLDSEPRSEA
ncbi:unnamed protein product [Ilex paraguariensis]|uniref:Auxin response factor n=1 Tax=Ilex paraguariensis TaxID=185542 RepID=A0ABC8QVZ4_9AQUA